MWGGVCVVWHGVGVCLCGSGHLCVWLCADGVLVGCICTSEVWVLVLGAVHL